MDNDKMQPQFAKDNNPPCPSEELPGSHQRPNETTYWETQEPPTPETPEQFYQYYEKQMKNQSAGPYDQHKSVHTFTDLQAQKDLYDAKQSDVPYILQQHSTTSFDSGNTGVYPLRKKKKIGRRMAVLTSILFVLLAVAGICYTFRDSVMNMVMLHTQTPVKYYAYIEKQTVEDALSNIAPYLDLYQQNSTIEVTTDIALKRDALDSLMQNAYGTSFSDMESYLGISLEHIGFYVISNSNMALSSNQIGFGINKKDLLTLELFTDMIKREALFRVPELSQAYIRQPLDSIYDTFDPNDYSFDFMTPEDNADLLKRYSKIVIDHITLVEIEKNTELTHNSFSVPCNKITVTITGEDINNIAMAVLEEAREDQYLHQFLPSFDLTVEEFQSTIDEALEELSNTSEATSMDSLVMLVYVNNQGRITGREIGISNSPSSFGYSTLDSNGMEQYNLFIKDEAGAKILNASGSHRKLEDGYHGSLAVVMESSSENASEASFDVTYQGVRTEKVDDRLYHYGSYIISSLQLEGLQVLVDNSVDNQLQKNIVTFQLGASPLVVIDTKLDYQSDYQLTPPTEDAVIFDSTQLESYLSTVDMEAFLNTLSDQLEVDLSWLLPYLLELPIQ